MDASSVKEFRVSKLNSVGPIHFGMTREQVRLAMGPHFRAFKRNDFALEEDMFFDNAISVQYDENGRCAAVTFQRGSKVSLMFDDKDLLKQSAYDVRDWARSMDDRIVLKDGFVSPGLGLGMWADWLDDKGLSRRADVAQSFTVFRAGYHEEEKVRVARLLKARLAKL